jgi:hypothetical protein
VVGYFKNTKILDKLKEPSAESMGDLKAILRRNRPGTKSSVKELK